MMKFNPKNVDFFSKYIKVSTVLNFLEILSKNSGI